MDLCPILIATSLLIDSEINRKKSEIISLPVVENEREMLCRKLLEITLYVSYRA